MSLLCHFPTVLLGRPLSIESSLDSSMVDFSTVELRELSGPALPESPEKQLEASPTKVMTSTGVWAYRSQIRCSGIQMVKNTTRTCKCCWVFVCTVNVGWQF